MNHSIVLYSFVVIVVIGRSLVICHWWLVIGGWSSSLELSSFSSSTLEMSLLPRSLCCWKKRSNCPVGCAILLHAITLYLAEMGLRMGRLCFYIWNTARCLARLVKRFHLCCNTTEQQIKCHRRGGGGDLGLKTGWFYLFNSIAWSAGVKILMDGKCLM